MSGYSGSVATGAAEAAAKATTATAAAIAAAASELGPPTTTATESTAPRQLDQLRVDLLLGLTQDADQVLGGLAVVGSEEGDGSALGAGTARTTDAVDVVLNVPGEVVVDDKLDVLDVYMAQLVFFKGMLPVEECKTYPCACVAPIVHDGASNYNALLETTGKHE